MGDWRVEEGGCPCSYLPGVVPPVLFAPALQGPQPAVLDPRLRCGGSI